MKTNGDAKYCVSLEFNSIRLPPVTDILVLGKKYPHGKHGVFQAFKYIAPDEFEVLDLNGKYDSIEAVFVDKRILKKIIPEKLLEILDAYVFPHIAPDEAIKVDFNFSIQYQNIKGDL